MLKDKEYYVVGGRFISFEDDYIAQDYIQENGLIVKDNFVLDEGDIKNFGQTIHLLTQVYVVEPTHFQPEPFIFSVTYRFQNGFERHLIFRSFYPLIKEDVAELVFQMSKDYMDILQSDETH